jgi:hypothetical protein
MPLVRVSDNEFLLRLPAEPLPATARAELLREIGQMLFREPKSMRDVAVVAAIGLFNFTSCAENAKCRV